MKENYPIQHISIELGAEMAGTLTLIIGWMQVGKLEKSFLGSMLCLLNLAVGGIETTKTPS